MVTVTNRPGSIDVTWATLARQTVSDFEWILCDELYDWRAAAVAAFVGDDRLHHVAAPRVEGHLWNLNKSYNAALRHCRGELVVSLQDYISVPPDGLERFLGVYREYGPRVMVSGVGHAYAPPPIADPGAKISVFARPYRPGDESDSRAAGVRTGTDARFDGGRGIVACPPGYWELNWGAAPLDAFYEIGGFPEHHDREFVSCDNLSIAYGAAWRGYAFFLDRSNECHLFDHRLVFARHGWEERHGQSGKWERWYRDWSAQGCPRLPYLSRS